METGIKLSPDQLAYRQIMDHVRTQLALGKMKPGDRLPTIRGLAGELGLNASTVARAYLILERDGVIVTRRGKGSFIASNSRQSVSPQRQQQLDTTVERSIVESLGLGFTLEDIEAAFTVHVAGWREQTAAGQRMGVRRRDVDIHFQGSHDLAVELLARHIGTLRPGLHFGMDFVGSLTGLLALERGEADIAGAHLLDEESGEYNEPYIRKLMPNESVLLVTLMQRIQGLMVKRGNPKHIIDFRDLAGPDITFVNRQKGSGTRILLDSQLRRQGIPIDRIRGYGREETTHIAVAQAVAQDRADVGLGAQSAANAAGLDFIPTVKERYDLVMLKDRAVKPPLNFIPLVVRSERFRTMLGAIPGYDTSATGKTYTIQPGAQKKVKV